MKQLILGSSSKHRLELFKTIGFVPNKILAADIDESWYKNEAPKDLAIRLAKQKAECIFEMIKNEQNNILFTADSVVSVGNRVVDKALTDEDVRDRMQMLSGKNHRCYSAFCIIDITDSDISKCKITSKCIETRIKFKKLSNTDIEQMIATKSGIGKAGGYGIQGFAESFVISISGSVSNIMGFSTYNVRNTLLSLGLAPNFDGARGRT